MDINYKDIGTAKTKVKNLLKQIHCDTCEYKCSDCYIEYEDLISIKTLLNHYEKLQQMNMEKNKLIKQLKQEIKEHCEQQLADILEE